MPKQPQPVEPTYNWMPGHESFAAWARRGQVETHVLDLRPDWLQRLEEEQKSYEPEVI